MVAAGAVTQAYVGGTFWQGFGAFFDPIVAHFGWSRAATAGALSLQRLEAGLISPFVGIFINRFGPRRVILWGVLVTGLGFVFLSQTHSLWQFYVAMSVIGIGLEFGSFFAIGITVANWFVVKRAMAMSLFTAGTGLGGLLVPVVVALIALTDWRMGLLVVGIGFWVIGIPVAMIMRSRPEEYGLYPDGGVADTDIPIRDQVTGRLEDAAPAVTSARSLSASGEPSFTLRQALLTRSFWQLSLALGVTQLTMSASVHHIPALADFGVSRATAGLVIMGVAMVSLASRLGTALVGDRLDKRWTTAFSFACLFLGTLIFANTGGGLHLLGFTIFVGTGWGVSVPLRFAIVADHFGRQHFGTIMGVMNVISTLFGVAGPVLVGWVFDQRGNYREPFELASLAALAGIPLILTLSRPARYRGNATPS